MTHAPQLRIPATYMRGGTSKGVFFRLQDLPEAAQCKLLSRKVARSLASPDSQDPEGSDYVRDNLFIQEDDERLF